MTWYFSRSGMASPSHPGSIHKTSGKEVGAWLGSLAESPYFSCSLVENGRCRCERCTGADASLSGIDHPGHLSAIRTGKPTTSSQQTEQFEHEYPLKSERNCSQLQPKSKMRDVQVIESMVARDG